MLIAIAQTNVRDRDQEARQTSIGDRSTRRRVRGKCEPSTLHVIAMRRTSRLLAAELSEGWGWGADRERSSQSTFNFFWSIFLGCALPSYGANAGLAK